MILKLAAEHKILLGGGTMMTGDGPTGTTTGSRLTPAVAADQNRWRHHDVSAELACGGVVAGREIMIGGGTTGAIIHGGLAPANRQV